MSIVPSDAYFDGDPDGDRADIVVSGFIVAVMLFTLATGFALVAFLAYQQMRGNVLVAAASPVAAVAENVPAIVDDTVNSDTVEAGSTAALSPANEKIIGDEAVAGEMIASPPVEPDLLPSVKPARTKPPTVTFDSSIIDDIDPPPSDAVPAEVAKPVINPSVGPATEDQTLGDVTVANEAGPIPQSSATPAITEQAAISTAPLDDTPAENASLEAAVVSEQPAQPEPAPSEQASPAPSATVAEPDAAPVLSAEPLAANAADIDALSGTHVVQVGSFRSEEEALADWRRIERRFPQLLAGTGRHIEPADLGERGVFYRLRIGPFGSVDGARTHCQALKDGGQDCLAVRH